MLNKNRLQLILPVILLLMGISAAWAIMALRPRIVTQTPKTEVPLVSVIQVEPQTIRLNVHSQGIVTPRNEIDLIPEVAGKVIHLHPDFVAGGFFDRNALLVAIDPRDYDYAIAQTQAQVAEAKRQLAMEEAQADQARNEWQALGDGAPSALAMREPQLAEARAKLKAAEANLTLARIKRNRCELRAPFTGRLQSKNIGLGQFIQPGDRLARIYSTDVAEIRLPLATGQLGFLDLPLAPNSSSAGSQTEAWGRGPKVTLTTEFAGKHEHEQKPIAELICVACTARFRPIFLAFLTNFAGFLPALLETSPQAQFLIPMTLSLSAGLLLGMTASLILTPVCYAVLGKA